MCTPVCWSKETTSSLKGSATLVGQLECRCRVTSRDRKCEGFTERGSCGHSGAGQRGDLVPVTEEQGVRLIDGNLK